MLILYNCVTDRHHHLRYNRNSRRLVKIMENTFRNEFGPVLSQSNLKAEVFIWDDFHDRYLISNLGGILVPYGFDTSSKLMT